MKNKTIVNILAMAEMYNHDMFSGTPPICITTGKPPEYPSQESINEYRKTKMEEYEQWLEQEIEEVE